MTNAVDQVPNYCAGVTPYLIVSDAKKAIDLYCQAFDAKAGIILNMSDGRIAHAEVILGSFCIMLSDENEAWGAKSPISIGACPVILTIYVEDIDAKLARATNAGMQIKKKLETHFFGDRMATLRDPFGYEWCLASRVENVPQSEMQARMNKLFS